MAGLGQTHQFVPLEGNVLTQMQTKHKLMGATTMVVGLDDRYVLSIPTKNKPDHRFIADQTNCAKQIISKEKTKDRLRRKLEERKSAN